jgi:spore coat protein U-like protein
MKKIYTICVILISLISFCDLYAQKSSSVTVFVKVKIIKGFSIKAVGVKSLDFGEIVSGSYAKKVSIPNNNGQRFITNGHPNRPVNVSYDRLSILKNINKTVDSRHDYILFESNVADQTGVNDFYENPSSVPSGSTVVLENQNGTGVLNLWLGGEINIAANQPSGEYIGNFNVTVTY